jgi:hypothetical protein
MKRRLTIEIEAGDSRCYERLGTECEHLLSNGGWGEGPGFRCTLFGVTLTDAAERCRRCLDAEQKTLGELLEAKLGDKLDAAERRIQSTPRVIDASTLDRPPSTTPTPTPVPGRARFGIRDNQPTLRK